MNDYANRIAQAVAYLQDRLGAYHPHYALVLGTGSQKMLSQLEVHESIDFTDIPFFSPTTAPSHGTRLVVASYQGVLLAVLEGRHHYYEGYDMQTITFPVRVLGAWGVDTLLLSAAVGGLLEGMQSSEIVLVNDHIHLQSGSPLRGANLDTYGPRFPDMSAPYDAQLRDHTQAVAQARNEKLREGVYVSVDGPQLETPAEYAYLRNIGGHVVGMSVTAEVIIARHMGLRCLALAVVSDLCYPKALAPINIAEVMAAVERAQPQLLALIGGVLVADNKNRK